MYLKHHFSAFAPRRLARWLDIKMAPNIELHNMNPYDIAFRDYQLVPDSVP